MNAKDTVTYRYRMSDRDVFYGGGVVNGARSITLMEDNSYSIKLLFIIIIRSIIMTIIYTTISYLIMNKIYDNKKIK